MENNRRHQLQRTWYDTALERQGSDTEAIKTVRLVSGLYFQLKLGHAVIWIYLHCKGMIETNRCWECTSQARMDTYYVLLSCSDWTEERRKMHEKCEKNGGRNLRTVKQLLGSRKATLAMLGFIKATRAGQRT